MEKQYGPSASEKKLASSVVKSSQPVQNQPEAKKTEDKKEEKTGNKVEIKPVVKKTEAVVNAMDLGISTKHSMAICDLIRGKNMEPMIIELEKISKLQKPIKMKGEIPHRHGNLMSGRYPVNACKVFIKLLKTLNANSNVNGLEDPYIAVAVPNRAARPHKRGGRERFKRTNVLLIAKERVRKENKQEKKK